MICSLRTGLRSLPPVNQLAFEYHWVVFLNKITQLQSVQKCGKKAYMTRVQVSFPSWRWGDPYEVIVHWQQDKNDKFIRFDLGAYFPRFLDSRLSVSCRHN